MDAMDQAQAVDEFLRETALQEHYNRGVRNAMAAAETECEECGGEIPEARRKAVPNCSRCVKCQERFEHKDILHHWR